MGRLDRGNPWGWVLSSFRTKIKGSFEEQSDSTWDLLGTHFSSVASPVGGIKP